MHVKISEESLAKVGVEIMDHARLILRCKGCAAEFSPIRKAGAKRMPKRWWLCQNGCNRPSACALCEKGTPPHLGLVRTCKECGTGYLLCFTCSDKYKANVFPCCLVVVPGRGVLPRSEAARIEAERNGEFA